MADITGIGWVTAAGMGCGRDQEPFAMTGGPLPAIKAAAVFDAPYPHFRRLDEYSKLGLAAIALALKDAGLDAWTEARSIGIIASTVYGCLQTDIAYYDTVMPESGAGASPALFAYTLPSSFLGEAAIRFGLTGSSFVINEPHPSGLSGIQTALHHIAAGEIEKILGGYCDSGCPPPFYTEHNARRGALFFMLEKVPAGATSSYGRLRWSKKGGLKFNGIDIKDLVTLVHKCRAAFHPAARQSPRA
jgi:3-oxoacyl-[acyl-carrier-protein] synthase II